MVVQITIIFFFCFTGICLGSDLKLDLVQVIFREGERTPNEGELTCLDAEISDFETYGLGQLTNRGKQQEFIIGTMLRRRYNDFLGQNYKPGLVHAYSAGIDYMKNSMELTLAGLFPPNKELQWNRNLNWIPIAIQSYPYGIDILMNPRACPEYQKALQKFLSSKKLRKILENYTETFETIDETIRKSAFLSKLTQEFIDHYMCIYNSIIITESFRFTYPNWYSKEIFSELEKFIREYFNILSYTKELGRKNAGPLVRKLFENIGVNSMHNRTEKMYLYAADGYVINAVSKALECSIPSEINLVSYGSAFIVEKYLDAEDNIFIKVLYWDGNSRIMNSFKFAHAEEYECPLNRVLNTIRDILPSDQEMRCLLEQFTDVDALNKLFADF